MDIAEIKDLQKDGKITRWPKKGSYKVAVIEHIYTKFSAGVKYSEAEINEIIKENIAFNDFALIRRELIDRGFLGRTRDCREYFKLDRE
ncbi:MAG: DUF2087 domain-containing protein [Turicibacter sp.]|nr:DUF2087 domain-containing protein [Turicibacter sp.]